MTATRYIKDQQILEDTWTHLDAEAPLPDDLNTAIAVPLTRFIAERKALTARTGPLAVHALGTDDIRELTAEDLKRLSLILLDFPHFKDGRCYSHAHILRTQLGYTGDLRAVGDVLIDQLFFMMRCGINEFALRSDKSFERGLKAFKDFSVVYQGTADERETVFSARHN